MEDAVRTLEMVTGRTDLRAYFSSVLAGVHGDVNAAVNEYFAALAGGRVAAPAADASSASTPSHTSAPWPTPMMTGKLSPQRLASAASSVRLSSGGGACAAPEVISLLDSPERKPLPTPSERDDDSPVRTAPAPIVPLGGAPLISPSSITWPLKLRPIIVSGTCVKRGRILNMYDSTFAVWSDRAMNAKYTAYDQASINLRFGVVERTYPEVQRVAIGRLPQSLANYLAPAIESGAVQATVRIQQAPLQLEIGYDMVLSVSIVLLRPASCILLPDFEQTWLLTRDHSAKRLELSLYELIVWCLDGRHVSDTAVPSATLRTPALAAAARAVTGRASQDVDAEEDGPDNKEDLMRKEDLTAVYARAEDVAPLPCTTQPRRLLAVNLRSYQQQALTWMLCREDGVDPFAGTANAAQSLTASWEQRSLPGGVRVWLDSAARRAQLSEPLHEPGCAGGILADEMGLGKTVEFCSLVLMQAQREAERRAGSSYAPGTRCADAASPSKVNARSDSPAAAVPAVKRARNNVEDVSAPSGLLARVAGATAGDGSEGQLRPYCRATLVVCPLTMVGQWQRELTRYGVPPTDSLPHGIEPPASCVSVLVYYGSDRNLTIQRLNEYDFVITSFGVLASEFSGRGSAVAGGSTSPIAAAGAKRQRESPLFSVKWCRVALDEAHVIRNPTTQQAKACHALQARYRWALTGTPIQNSLQDLHSLVKFLQHAPCCDDSWWKAAISIPYDRGDPRGMAVLTTMLRPLMLRRTKKMRTLEGRTIVDMAPPQAERIFLTLDDDERYVYDKLYERSKIKFQGYLATGSIMSKYAAIFTLLLRLRQACLHPQLIINSLMLLDLSVLQNNVARDGSSSSSSSSTTTTTTTSGASGRADTSSSPIAATLAGEAGAGAAVEEVEEAPVDNSLLPREFLAQMYASLQERWAARTALGARARDGYVRSYAAVAAGAGSSSAVAASAAPLPLTSSPQADRLTPTGKLDVDALDSSGGPPNFLARKIASLADGGMDKDAECIVCLEQMVPRTTTMLVCGHMLCTRCAQIIVEQAGGCPECRQPITWDDVRSLDVRSSPMSPSTLGYSARTECAAATAVAPAAKPRSLPSLTHEARVHGSASGLRWGQSTKLTRLLQELTGIQAHNAACAEAAVMCDDATGTATSSSPRAPGAGGAARRGAARSAAGAAAASHAAAARAAVTCAHTTDVFGMSLTGSVKVVVFSFFTSMLDLVQAACSERGMECARLDGTMGQAAREGTLRSFTSPEGPFVLLMSLKAGSLGLNLTEASIVYLLDPWWNPSTEAQAIGRVHRMGQKKTVYVRRLLVRDTIEDNMLAIQERKQRLAEGALGDSAMEGSAKLSEEELKMFFRR